MANSSTEECMKIVSGELEININSEFLQLKWLPNQSRIVNKPVICICYDYGTYLTTEFRKHLTLGSDCELLDMQSLI